MTHMAGVRATRRERHLSSGSRSCKVSASSSRLDVRSREKKREKLASGLQVAVWNPRHTHVVIVAGAVSSTGRRG